ncbi:hypothetical protein GCM10009554_43740 [Kribbella koreensis]|uniref:Uncharacterized protein n=1 Tax=Kribbella koreensis TaxID=57909 RepID=A0ABN1QUD2_9ACTN
MQQRRVDEFRSYELSICPNRYYEQPTELNHPTAHDRAAVVGPTCPGRDRVESAR